VTRPGAAGMRPEAMAGLRLPARPHAGCRAGWQTETVTEVRQETLAARTLVLEAPGWLGTTPGTTPASTSSCACACRTGLLR